jgi:hypothetical protein
MRFLEVIIVITLSIGSVPELTPYVRMIIKHPNCYEHFQGMGCGL